MSGFSSDGKRTRFWIDGRSFETRSFDHEDALHYTTTPLMALLASILFCISQFGASGTVLGDQFLTGYGAVATLIGFFFGFGSLISERPFIWREIALIVVSYLLLERVHEGGVPALWQLDSLWGVATLLAVFGGYGYHAVARLAWEPLVIALLFCGGIGAIATGIGTASAFAYFVVLAILSLFAGASVLGSYENQRRGFNSLPD